MKYLLNITSHRSFLFFLCNLLWCIRIFSRGECTDSIALWLVATDWLSVCARIRCSDGMGNCYVSKYEYLRILTQTPSGNTEAEVILPAKKDINKVNVNGQLVKTILKDGKVFLPVLRSGVYHIVLNWYFLFIRIGN